MSLNQNKSNRDYDRLYLFTISERPFPILLVILSVLANLLIGQVSSGGMPRSFSESTVPNIHTVITPPVDVETLLYEDAIEQSQGLPYRFGFGTNVDYSLDNSGTWENISDGGRLWRLRILSPGAFSINLIYDEFWLPNGASFFIYNRDTGVS